MTHVRIVAVALLFACAFLFSRAFASTPTRWTAYHKVRGTSSIARVRIPTRCISAEDSAAHVYLYAYGNGVATYRCTHHGY